jgi:hypothetical protein
MKLSKRSFPKSQAGGRRRIPYKKKTRLSPTKSSAAVQILLRSDKNDRE